MYFQYDDRNQTYQTKFAIAYDADFIYFAIKAFDPEPTDIGKRLTRRDHIDGDYLSVNIDSYHDLQTAYEFSESAAGTKHFN